MVHSSRMTVPRQGRRTRFTLQRAQRALVLVRRIVADAVEEYRRLLEFQEMLELAQQRGAVEHLQHVQSEMTASAGRLQALSDELEAVGAELCDYSCGRVEFPAVSGGREVRLCWQLGQDGISAWYVPGFSQTARRAISELQET